MKLKALIGSGDKIMLLVLPFLIVGLTLNILIPAAFSVGGPSAALRAVSLVLLISGIAIWAWSVGLILTKVPRRELITGGPYALVKHPIYTAVALLILPWAGFLLNTWLGVLLGAALYSGSRRYAPDEERSLAEAFGPAWEAYTKKVMIPWL